jgi:hypothetical protein
VSAERFYCWLQDRIVHTCALEGIGELEEVRTVLREESHRYGNHHVHYSTREIPSVRFDKSIAQANSLFRPFSVHKPYAFSDVFSLRERGNMDTRGRISLFGH